MTNFIPDRIELNCKTTFIEECHNEYKMVCEETTVEREREVCETVQEKICKKGVNTEYEPACFQRIISHCDRVSVAGGVLTQSMLSARCVRDPWSWTAGLSVRSPWRPPTVTG